MPTLLDQAGKVTDLREALRNLAEQKAVLTRLRTRANQLNTVQQRCAELSNAASLLSAAQIPLEAAPRATAALRKKGEAVLTMAQSDWDEFVNDDSLKPQFIDPCDGYAGRVEAKLLEQWKSYVSAVRPAVTKDFLILLSQSGFSETVNQIKALLDQISLISAGLPSDESEIRSLSDSSEAARNLISQLDGIPEDVRIFLSKAAQGNALIDDLTDSVRQWLLENNMLDQLRIRFG